MIGLDTNIPVRCIMQDAPLQSAKATQLLESLDANGLGFVALWR
jgi:predicted nucleic-acid-binding protein